MSMIAFFPWFTVCEPTTVGSYALIPWRRGELGRTLDEILAAYVAAWDDPEPIESATLVHMVGRPLTGDLSEDDRAQLFEFADLVAFTALARRQLFTIDGYVNRDQFRLVIQAFKEGDEHPSIVIRTRRRDGPALSLRVPGVGHFPRPYHIERVALALDEDLLNALVRAAKSASALAYEEAIFSFNQANTDAEQVMEHHEIVSLVGSFERLLEVRSGADEVAPKVVRLVGQFVADKGRLRLARINGSESQRGAPISKSLTEAWVRDVYRVRNAFGHGRKRSNRPSEWTLKQHLLLGSYLFPLAVLARLSKDGLYQLTKRDEDDLFAFTYLAYLRNAFRQQKRCLWNIALQAAERRRSRQRAIEAMRAAEAATDRKS